ncbi:MAG TPA: VIT domain-containing protein [Tepidisphaeraceae bacterium]|jgi:Ca-activated chloride channel family protein
MRDRLPAFVSALVLLILAGVCRADGFIVITSKSPPAVPGHFAFAPLEVTFHRVSVKIDDLLAVTSVDEEFYNPNNQRLEGMYLFPLPAGSHIDRFSMDINGQMTDAELLSADKARSLYEDIVRRYRDPALLEYSGRDAFKVRIFPIEPNGRKHVKIQYTQLLKSDSGTAEYTYPLNTEKFSSVPIRDVTIAVELACREPIKSVYSPTHSVQIKREDELHARAFYEQHQIRPDTDFKLIFSRNKSPVGVDLLTYRSSPDDGYFLLLASPGLQPPKGQVEKKDVCFVLDTSGSMAGPKIEQAKKALTFCLNSLNEGDRFEVIRFSTETEPLFHELRPADKANTDKALAFVKDLRASGGTDIDGALHDALKLRPDANDAHPYVVVFLTDGEPTVGDTSEDSLVSKVTRYRDGKTKIFCFGIGNDVNTHLLDRIAEGTHAFSTYVEPQEDIEVKVSAFYDKIREPVLSNVEVAFTGSDVRVMQVYPGAMPDLYKGEMLVAFGRYSGHGPAAVKITGTFDGQPQQFVQDVKFAADDTTNAYIPRLWAVRRVGYLLDQIRMHGESAELRDEVTRLAREHGIVTPYTAYLILEDERRRNVPVSIQNFREFGADRPALAQSQERMYQAQSEAQEAQKRTGSGAVAAAKDVGQLKASENLDQLATAQQQQALAKGGFQGQGPSAGEQPQAMFGTPAAGRREFAARATATTQPAFGYRVAQNYTQQSKVINGRAFYQNGTTWTDSSAQARKDLKPQQIDFGSDAYFALLKAHPEAAPWLSLSNQVDVVIGDTLYQVR